MPVSVGIEHIYSQWHLTHPSLNENCLRPIFYVRVDKKYLVFRKRNNEYIMSIKDHVIKITPRLKSSLINSYENMQALLTDGVCSGTVHGMVLALAFSLSLFSERCGGDGKGLDRTQLDETHNTRLNTNYKHICLQSAGRNSHFKHSTKNNIQLTERLRVLCKRLRFRSLQVFCMQESSQKARIQTLRNSVRLERQSWNA